MHNPKRPEHLAIVNESAQDLELLPHCVLAEEVVFVGCRELKQPLRPHIARAVRVLCSQHWLSAIEDVQLVPGELGSGAADSPLGRCRWPRPLVRRSWAKFFYFRRSAVRIYVTVGSLHPCNERRR